MTKPDWASRKAHAIIDRDCLRLALPDEIAKALRQERRRAVRLCRVVAKAYPTINGLSHPQHYQRGATDCATAIAGGK